MNQWKNRLSGLLSRKIDWVIFALFSIIVLVSLYYFFHMYTLLPSSRLLWILIAVAAVVVILWIISFLLIRFHKLKTVGTWIHRVVMVLLCVVLCFASYTIQNSSSTLSIVTQGDQSVIKISVITMADSGITDIADLSGKNVGVQNGLDQDNATYARDLLDEEVAGVNYTELLDYTTMYDQLREGELDAMIISNTSIALLQDHYENLQSDIRVLTTYERESTSVNTATTDKDLRTEPFVIYLGGMDEGEDPSINGRCDVNILLLVNPKVNKITTISIPRDSYVPNPALGYASDKLTHLGNNGPENSIAGLEEFTGIDIDYYAKINFFSVIEIVDAIGGVDVDVQLDFCEQDEYRNKDADHQICLSAGEQHLNGQQALAYSRHRKTATWGTQGREYAQTQIIEAIINKLTTVEGASNVNSVMNIAQRYVSTNIPMEQLSAFLSYQLDHLAPWTVESITLTDGYDMQLTTASMTGTPLDCHLLTIEDAQLINLAYNSMYETPAMSDFQFNVNDLGFSDVEVDTSEYMVWASDVASLNSYTLYYGMDHSVSYGNSDTVTTPQEEPQTPSTETPQETTPTPTPTPPESETTPPSEPQTPQDPGSETPSEPQEPDVTPPTEEPADPSQGEDTVQS